MLGAWKGEKYFDLNCTFLSIFLKLTLLKEQEKLEPDIKEQNFDFHFWRMYNFLIQKKKLVLLLQLVLEYMFYLYIFLNEVRIGTFENFWYIFFYLRNSFQVCWVTLLMELEKLELDKVMQNFDFHVVGK